MDDDKSIAEKLTHAIGKAADSVKSTMSNLVDTASQAAQYAMESNAERMSGQTVAELAPSPIAATEPAPKTKRKPRARPGSGKAPPAKKSVAKKPARKSAKKRAAKPAAKRVARKSKNKSAKKKSARKTKKKSKR
jgi:hypothetical protein